ncbi:MAG: hypothetical protein C3F07_01655 [Anaerolineales bacterium]|nr:hypothetical protein [Anaerolineae bacterium]PWB77665.1 MAG: hypothetical protein C3F07_01655 [Anaerolineales bacterium]
MIEFENTIQIQRPVNEVFAFLSDLENLPKWNYFVLQVKKVSDGPVGVGATYHQVRKTDEQTLRIVELAPPEKIRVTTISRSYPRLEMELVLQENGAASQVTDRWKLESGRPVLLEKLAARQVQSAVHENLTKLKELMENGRVVLQDGRQSSLQ